MKMKIHVTTDEEKKASFISIVRAKLDPISVMNGADGKKNLINCFNYCFLSRPLRLFFLLFVIIIK